MRIALICAHPAGTNTGMVSVDFAFEYLINRFLQSHEIVRFCSWRHLQFESKDSMTYHRLYDIGQLENFDRIIYWGDFLHWLGYAKHDWHSKSKVLTPDLSDNEIQDLWYQLYLLENRPDLQSKTIVFGSTIYGLHADELSDIRYRQALTSLYKNAIACYMRDIVSAHYVQQLVPEKTQTFGCDCALLLESNEFVTGYGFANNRNPYMVYSFVRSKANEQLIKFANSMADSQGLDAVDLSWLTKGAGIQTLFEKVNLIQQSQFVITDTYHCAVNAIRERKPTICFSRGAQHVHTSVSDKKKEFFFKQIFGERRHLFVETLLDNLESQKSYELYVANQIESINNQAITDIINNTVEQQTTRALQRLLEAIENGSSSLSQNRTQ